MSRRRKLFVIGVCIACILLVLILASSFLNNGNTATQSPPSNMETLNPNPKEPLLVVPENPLGTLGIVSSLVAAIGLYVFVKKEKQLPL
jgi:hypothetical protein